MAAEPSGDYSTSELMVTAISRELRDGELGFVGVGTAGRAFTLAVGIPIAAARLAQLTHAPDFVIYWGNLLSPDLEQIPARFNQDSITRWRASASLSDTGFKVDMLTKGGFDVAFESAAQVDRFGNLNITSIGEYAHPRVRLVGCLAQTEHLAFVRRPIVVVDLEPRTFVEKVDFITSVGHFAHGQSRQELGLRSPGPYRVVTDKAIFDFDETTRELRLLSLHPGVTTEDVLSRLSFRPLIHPRVERSEPPTKSELRLIREVIDRDHLLLRE
jgi:glutaconate CoA-transferase, subunit B